ncbi:metallophosphoesterase [Peristeroidobacter soli]|uniref:metallophosphoesterase n=1 Tax=Peristeroidobacter soli TaxID=2497877 RepID=UPI00101DE072|nr:metallophosphoesterase [Peristeroidobacter soli]
MASTRSRRAKAKPARRKTRPPLTKAGYDIIGDVHGCHLELTALLKQMGYSKRAGVWRHKQRKAVFVGDLVDRGPAIRETLETVAAMVDAGAAHCILGNHERDFIYYYMNRGDGKPIREHNKVRKKQLRETHRQLSVEEGLISHWISWLRKLPLVFEAPGLRVVHAAWNHNAVEYWRERNLGDKSLYMELSDHKTKPSAYLDRLLFGPWLTYEKDGKEKTTRVRWYASADKLAGTTVWHGAFRRNSKLPRREMTDQEKRLLWGYPSDAPPLFTGHQSLPLDAKMKPMRANLACVDYSAVYGGRLCAYRWSGEKVLKASSFVAVPAHPKTQAAIRKQKEIEAARQAEKAAQAKQAAAAAAAQDAAPASPAASP